MRKRFENKREFKNKQVLNSLLIIEDFISQKLNYNKEILIDCTLDTPWFIPSPSSFNSSSSSSCSSFISSNINNIPERYEIDWNNIPSNIDPASGELEELRAKRKRQQLESLVILVEDEIKNCLVTNPCIIDFGAGSGHLGLIIAYRNPQVRVILVERKEYSVNVAKERIENCGLTNVIIDQRNVQEILQESPIFDIGVSLHSCGQLTDLSLRMCHQSKASFVLTPCCYGQITNPPPIVNSSNISINNFSSFNIEDNSLFSSIVSFADYSTCFFDSPTNNQNEDSNLNENNMKSFLLAKRCMRVIDFDRLISTCSENNQIVEINYENKDENNDQINSTQMNNNYYYIFRQTSLKPLTCSPKNNVIIGRCIKN